MINKDTNIDRTQTYVITDIHQCFAGIVACLLFGFFAYYFGGTREFSAFAPFFWVISFIAGGRIFVVVKGFIVNPTENTVSFWGGGVEANDPSDYINPMFWLQYFRRFTIKLDEIEGLRCNSKHSTNKDGKSSTRYFLCMNGSFGASNVKFFSEGKRNQAYTILAQLNEMGSPISNR